jgi:thiol-disulfide isomerase/thioredoxin
MSPIVVRLAILAALALVTWIGIRLLRRWFDGADAPARFDLSDVSGEARSPVVVEFTSPYCYECKTALPLLKAAALVHDASFELIDARDRPDLAGKYGIRRVPTILVVDGKGAVKASWLGTPPEPELEAALTAASNGNGRRPRRALDL